MVKNIKILLKTSKFYWFKEILLSMLIYLPWKNKHNQHPQATYRNRLVHVLVTVVIQRAEGNSVIKH